MTLSEARDDLYGIVSKNSELDPATPTGAAILDRYLNRAYKAILSWKSARGTLRFPASRATLLFQAPTYTGTASAGTTTTLTIPTSGLITTDDYYIEWVIEITSGTGSGQARVVVDWDGTGGVATVHKAFDTTPDATSVFLLTKRFMEIMESGDTGEADGILLDPEDTFRGALKLTSLDDGSDLVLAEGTENYSGSLTETGTPGEFFVQGERIYFNVAPDETRWYRLEYAKTPASLTDPAEEFALPSPWDQAVVMMARWWVLVRYGEVEDAYSAKRDYQEFLASLALPGEDLGDRTPSGTGRLF